MTVNAFFTSLHWLLARFEALQSAHCLKLTIQYCIVSYRISKFIKRPHSGRSIVSSITCLICSVIAGLVLSTLLYTANVAAYRNMDWENRNQKEE